MALGADKSLARVCVCVVKQDGQLIGREVLDGRKRCDGEAQGIGKAENWRETSELFNAKSLTSDHSQRGRSLSRPVRNYIRVAYLFPTTTLMNVPPRRQSVISDELEEALKPQCLFSCRRAMRLQFGWASTALITEHEVRLNIGMEPR